MVKLKSPPDFSGREQTLPSFFTMKKMSFISPIIISLWRSLFLSTGAGATSHFFIMSFLRP